MELYEKLKRMKTILIDDDEWIRDSLSLFFSSEGCHMLAVETAEEALKALDTEDYDIVIADYKLPGIDGLTFFKQIQKRHPVPLKILITAYGNEELFSKAGEMGVHDFIPKPFTSKDIEKSLENLLENGDTKRNKASL